MEGSSRCQMCGRDVRQLTQHHLIPRAEHKRKKKRDGLTRDFLNTVISICAPCHKNLHAVLTERELADDYNTARQLLTHPLIAKFTAWVRKQGDAPIRVRSSNDKRERKRQG